MMIDLKPIYEYANEVLANLKPDEVEGAINWGDLSCTDVEECRSVHNDFTAVRVTIEEADPNNVELWEYMGKMLGEKFPDIQFQVVTEW